MEGRVLLPTPEGTFRSEIVRNMLKAKKARSTSILKTGEVSTTLYGVIGFEKREFQFDRRDFAIY